MATAAFDLDSVRFRCESLILTVYGATVDTQSQVCQDTPVPLALAPPHRPPRAARMDLRDACCSRNPPDPQRSRHAMRPRARRPPTPSASHPCSLPFAGEAAAIDRETRPLLPIRHPCPARARAGPPFLSPGHPARSPVAAGSSPSAPWTRQTARAGGLVSTLTPRRAVRRRSSNLSG